MKLYECSLWRAMQLSRPSCRMIRDKPDSYCFSWDLFTDGISGFVQDLNMLYVNFGMDPAARFAYMREAIVGALDHHFERGLGLT